MIDMLSDNTLLLGILLAVPFITSMLSFACNFSKENMAGFVSTVNFVGITALLIVSLLVVCKVAQVGEIMGAGKWLYIDSLSAVFLFVLGVISFITGLYSYGYITEERKHGELSLSAFYNYFGFFHLFIFTMLIVVTTNNLILMWAGIEATTLSSAFLVGIYGQNSSLEAAWKYIIICTVGVAFGLYGTILVYSNASSAMVAAGVDAADAIFWTEALKYAGGFDHTLMYIAFVFALIGFGTKSGLFPMHAWLPDAHSESPSPTSALLSAVLLKCAFLVILRYYIIVNRSVDDTLAQHFLLAFGLLSILVAGLFFLVQKDLKRKLAYSSVENMGLIAVGIGFGGPLGVFASLLHVINHSLVKTLLFCASGNILLKFGTRDTNVVKGVLKVMPATGILLAGGALALGGLPPFNIFISEFLVVVAGIKSGSPYLTFLMLIFLMVVLAGLVTLVAQSVLGSPPKEVAKGELGSMTVLPLVLTFIMIVIMGTSIPKPVTQLLRSATSIVTDGKGIASLSEIAPDLSSILKGSQVEPAKQEQHILTEGN